MDEQSARQHHEQVDFQRDALSMLRDGFRLTDQQWRQRHPGSRLPPVIDKLRNAHGFIIDGYGSVESQYWMPDADQPPLRVAVTEPMKLAYYETEHWRRLAQRRRLHDGDRCVICHAMDELQVHHICYVLFDEHINDLMTVCRPHHEKIHQHSRIKFPSGMTPDKVAMLGISYEMAEWLLPPFALRNF